MHFFEHQRQARNKTYWLVVFFVLTVLLISVGITFAAVLSLFLAGPEALFFYETHDFWQICLQVGIYVIPIHFLLIGGASFWRVWTLGGDGLRLAHSLGATPLQGQDLKSQMLRNVVEEMSIAAGIAPPLVVVLEGQDSINAFAAGSEISNAVIGVTRGLIDELTREQMQAVVAHELSHIVHGDMTLNMRLVGAIFGILLIYEMGQAVVRGSRHSTSRNRGGGSIVFFGFFLLLLGSIGSFFASWIKSLISQQREFLADASAVQFTRNPQALGEVFHKMQFHSSHLSTPNLESVSHMFIGPVKYGFLFKTHPSLHQRIAALEKMGYVARSPERNTSILYEPASSQNGATGGGMPVMDQSKAAHIVANLGLCLDPYLGSDKEVQDSILILLALHSGDELALRRFNPQHVTQLRILPLNQYLYAIERSLNWIAHLHLVESKRFISRVEDQVYKDARMSAFECAVLNILRRRLSLMPQTTFTPFKLSAIEGEVRLALGTMVLLAKDIGKSKEAADVSLRGMYPDSMESNKELTEASQLQAKIVDRMFLRLSHCTLDAREQVMSALRNVASISQPVPEDQILLLQAFAMILDVPLISDSTRAT